MIRSINNTTTSFKGVGVSDALVKVFDAIARGGKAADFMVQDVTACGLPRTVSSLNRNREKTGKLNYIAATETALRESLTGTSMFLVPMAVQAVARKLTGTANDIPVKSIKDLSDIISKSTQNANFENNARKVFYEDVFTRVGENMGLKDKELSNFAKEITEDVCKIENAPKRNFLKRMFAKGNGTCQDELLGTLIDKFSKIKKTQVSNLSDDLLSAQLSENNSVAFGKLITYVKKYADDFTKKAPKNIEQFKNLRIGSRFITNVALTLLSGVVLVILPKIYSISKTNPEAEIDNVAEVKQQ